MSCCVLIKFRSKNRSNPNKKKSKTERKRRTRDADGIHTCRRKPSEKSSEIVRNSLRDTYIPTKRKKSNQKGTFTNWFYIKRNAFKRLFLIRFNREMFNVLFNQDIYLYYIILLIYLVNSICVCVLYFSCASSICT